MTQPQTNPSPNAAQVAHDLMASDLSPQALLCGLFLACASTDATRLKLSDIGTHCDMAAPPIRRALAELEARGFAQLCAEVVR